MSHPPDQAGCRQDNNWAHEASERRSSALVLLQRLCGEYNCIKGQVMRSPPVLLLPAQAPLQAAELEGLPAKAQARVAARLPPAMTPAHLHLHLQQQAARRQARRVQGSDAA